MSVNWTKIRNEYVSGGGSYADLAEKYNVSYSTLSKRGAEEGWTETKERQLQIIRNETDRKAAEKISDSESEIAATMSRIRKKLTDKIEQAVDRMENVDTNELRKLVQSYKDMTEANAGTDEERNGVLNDILDAVRGVGDD